MNALIRSADFRAGACRPGRAAGTMRSFAPTGPTRPGSERNATNLARRNSRVRTSDHSRAAKEIVVRGADPTSATDIAHRTQTYVRPLTLTLSPGYRGERTGLRALVLTALLIPLWAQSTFAQVPPPPPAAPTGGVPILRDVGIDQKLDSQVPADLAFRDEQGRTVRLGDYFGSRPVILALVYYKCPMLCTMVLNDLTRGMNGVTTMSAGEQFDVLAVSFDPNETPALAAAKKVQYVRAYRRPRAEEGMHFLTGSPESIKALTQAVGFRYTWDAEHQVFAHASGIIILTPGGKVSRYFFGIDYAPHDLRLSLLEAAEDKIAPSATERVLLYCFHYDPRTGRYGLIISRMLRVGGVLTVLLLAGFVAHQARRERRTRVPGP
jgi:protein SCO1/2